jgi:leader peptidase (prepilin peptidase)/N-methyltransferase
LVLALLFGSFLNVCISRLPEHRSIVRPGSHCPRCQAPVRPRDNIPVVSWLLLRGRCRDCGRPIAMRYPLVEAGYTVLVALSIARFGFTADAAAAAVFCFFALGLLVMDLETMLLPDAFTLPGLALGLLWAFAAPVWARGDLFGRNGLMASLSVSALAVAALSAAGWALLLLVVRWGYYAVRRHHGLGLGDVKLVAMLAAWLGAPRTALCFLLAVIAAALFGLTALRGGAFLRSQVADSASATWGAMRVPLGAFLCVGSLYSLFFGEHTLQWYFSLWA